MDFISGDIVFCYPNDFGLKRFEKHENLKNRRDAIGYVVEVGNNTINVKHIDGTIAPYLPSELKRDNSKLDSFLRQSQLYRDSLLYAKIEDDIQKNEE